MKIESGIPLPFLCLLELCEDQVSKHHVRGQRFYLGLMRVLTSKRDEYKLKQHFYSSRLTLKCTAAPKMDRGHHLLVMAGSYIQLNKAKPVTLTVKSYVGCSVFLHTSSLIDVDMKVYHMWWFVLFHAFSFDFDSSLCFVRIHVSALR